MEHSVESEKFLNLSNQITKFKKEYKDIDGLVTLKKQPLKYDFIKIEPDKSFMNKKFSFLDLEEDTVYYEQEYYDYEYNGKDYVSVAKTKTMSRKKVPNPDNTPINKEFLVACEEENVNLIKELLFNSSREEKPNIHSRYYKAEGTGPIDACLDIVTRNGNLEILKIFLEDKRIAHEFDLTTKAHNLANTCCDTGNLEMLKYLTNNQLTRNHIRFNEKDRLNILTSAAQKGHDHILEYLFNSPDIPVNCIEAIDEWTIAHPCIQGHVQSVRFLSQYADKKLFHYMNDMPFNNCYNRKDNPENMQVLNFLIFEFDIELTDAIKDIIKDDEIFLQKFKLRELNKTLEQNLNNTNKKSEKKNKI